MLIRAVYRGVMFHQPLSPGTTTVDVTVYDPTSDAKTVKVGSRADRVPAQRRQPARRRRVCAAEPVAAAAGLFQREGRFQFRRFPTARSSRRSLPGDRRACPWCREPSTAATSKYAIAYAFQPGDNGVRLSYQVPYPSNQTTLKFTSDYSAAARDAGGSADRAGRPARASCLPAPSRDSICTRATPCPPGLPFEVAVSGTAPPPPAGAGADQGRRRPAAQGQARQDPGERPRLRRDHPDHARPPGQLEVDS